MLWKKHKIHNKYLISEKGDIFSVKNGIILKKRFKKNGYIQYVLNGKHLIAHRLVAELFLPNKKNFPVVNHLDGDKRNNDYTNLEWCTYQHNMIHAHKTGLKKGRKGEGCNFSKLKKEQVYEIRALIKNGFKDVYLSKKFNVTRSNITLIRLNKIWKHI